MLGHLQYFSLHILTIKTYHYTLKERCMMTQNGIQLFKWIKARSRYRINMMDDCYKHINVIMNATEYNGFHVTLEQEVTYIKTTTSFVIPKIFDRKWQQSIRWPILLSNSSEGWFLGWHEGVGNHCWVCPVFWRTIRGSLHRRPVEVTLPSPTWHATPALPAKDSNAQLARFGSRRR